MTIYNFAGPSSDTRFFERPYAPAMLTPQAPGKIMLRPYAPVRSIMSRFSSADQDTLVLPRGQKRTNPNADMLSGLGGLGESFEECWTDSQAKSLAAAEPGSEEANRLRRMRGVCARGAAVGFLGDLPTWGKVTLAVLGAAVVMRLSKAFSG